MENLKDLFEKKEEIGNPSQKDEAIRNYKPSRAFVLASWMALGSGIAAYLIGLNNSTMMLNEKGYYLAVLLLGLFSAISLQKTVRDKVENIPTTNLYFIICWVALFSAIALVGVGLWNAGLTKSEKGFYAMSFVLSIFASIAVQKNVRDNNA